MVASSHRLESVAGRGGTPAPPFMRWDSAVGPPPPPGPPPDSGPPPPCRRPPVLAGGGGRRRVPVGDRPPGPLHAGSRARALRHPDPGRRRDRQRDREGRFLVHRNGKAPAASRQLIGFRSSP